MSVIRRLITALLNLFYFESSHGIACDDTEPRLSIQVEPGEFSKDHQTRELTLSFDGITEVKGAKCTWRVYNEQGAKVSTTYQRTSLVDLAPGTYTITLYMRLTLPGDDAPSTLTCQLDYQVT